MVKKNRKRSKYSFANINLLGKCNYDCFFCLGKDIDELNDVSLSPFYYLNNRYFNIWKNFNKFLDLCIKHNIKSIYITGLNTDPLLYKHLHDLIKYLQDSCNFNVGIRTNGLLLNLKTIEVINKCKEEIGITALSFYPSVVKKITGNIAIPNFSLMSKIVPPVRISTVVTKYNVSEIPDMIKYFATIERNVKYFQIRRIATDTRDYKMKDHIKKYDYLKKQLLDTYHKYGSFEKAPILRIHGLPVTLWETVNTTANSINYFTNGIISEEYFVIEGYLMNKDKYIIANK